MAKKDYVQQRRQGKKKKKKPPLRRRRPRGRSEKVYANPKGYLKNEQAEGEENVPKCDECWIQ